MAMLRVRLALGRHASTSSASSAAATNWLEANCGDVPTHPRAFDTTTSEMLRGGHALQVANRALLSAHLKSSSRVSAPTRDPTHVETLQTLKRVEDTAVERIENAVAKHSVRFRPSLLLPVLQCSGAILGGVLSLFGAHVSDAYQTGVKTAISDYYNDQIREIYESRPDELELKELFKVTRDEEIAFVDARSPDGVTPDPVAAEHPAAMVAKASSKLLVQVVKAL